MRVDWWKKDNECKRLNQINMKYSVIIMVFLMFKSVIKIVLYEWYALIFPMQRLTE